MLFDEQDLKDRALRRIKYLEDSNYRRWSDITPRQNLEEESFLEYTCLGIERRWTMTHLDEELDYEEFVNTTGGNLYGTDLDLEYRGYQRDWYLEDANYRQLSDVIKKRARL